MLIKSDLYEADGVDQPQGIVVGLSGFTTGSVGRMFSRDPEESGVGGIISAVSHLPVEQVILGYDQTEEAINQIITFKENFPDGKVVLIGHSLGGNNIFTVAQALEEKGIVVNLFIPIDSVGSDDSELPGNVLVGVNYFSTSKDGIDGQSEIQGAINIGIDGTTHTKIDEEITNQITNLVDYAVSGTSSNSNLFGSSLTTSDQSTPANDILPEPQTLGPLFSIPPSLFNPIGSSLSQEETPQVEQIAPLSDNQIQTTQSATANQSAPNNQIVEDQSTDFFETTGLVDETELHPELENSESTQVTFASENASSLQNPPIESLSAGDSSTIEESDDISASAPASFDENPDSIALEEPTAPALEVESDQPDMLSTEPVEGDITDGLSEQSVSNVEFNQTDFDDQTLVPASLDTTPTDSTFENDSAATHSELVGNEPETESPEQTLALDQPQPSMDQPGAEELSSQVNTDDASWFAENT
ncbi:MAG TPA: hypothetical protein PLS70_13845, partial [Acidobacteriota bacterium]|nr:hypothetical protein [Acidobacteriota bacterium]